MSTQGKPRWYKPDVGLSMRMLLTIFLLGAVYVVGGVILVKLGAQVAVLVIFAVIIGIIQLFFSDKIALASMGAREVTERAQALIVTRGAEGSSIYTQDREIQIPTAQPKAVVDPTGCGDAYRAGLIHGLLHGLDWETTGRIASLMGAIKIEQRGTQNHRFTSAEFAERYRASFGAALAPSSAVARRAAS